MGLGHSPQTVTNGLVFALDAGNAKNYSLTSVEVLVVAGGGGGGMDMGGGGGGGGVIYNPNVTVTPGSAVTVTVGAGGYGAPAGGGGYRTDGAGPQPANHQFTIPATNGGNSVFGALTAIGGGAGGSSYFQYTPGATGSNGGSGGGSSGYSDGGTRAGGTGTSGQGFAGGQGGPQYYSGGGGGAGGPGVSGPNRPDGGPGVIYPISPYYFGGGGGGASYSLSTGGYGGIGGGGGGALGVAPGGAGLNNGSAGGGGGPNQWAQTPGGNAGANTGGGGGGGSHYNSNNKGGEGGSGIVIVRYPGPQRALGGTVTSVNGYTIHTFTTVGSSTFTPLVATNNSAISGLSDFSGRNNFAATQNSPIYGSDNLGTINLDGLNDYIIGYNDANLFTNNSSLTVSMFVNINEASKSTRGALLSSQKYQSETNPGGFGFCILDNGQLCVNLVKTISGTSTSNEGLVPFNFVRQQFRYYTFTYDSSSATVKTYMNEVLQNTSTNVNYGWTINPENRLTHIGRNHQGGWSDYYNMKIGTVQVYNRALTAAEISQNFNALRGRFGI